MPAHPRLVEAQNTSTPPDPRPGGMTDDQCLRLASAIAGRTDLIRLHTGTAEDNRYDTEAPWPTRRPDRPFTVYLNGPRQAAHALVLDLDDKPGSNVRADVRTAMAALSDAGIEFVHAQSGPTAGAHLFMTCTTPIPDTVTGFLRSHLPRLVPSLDTSLMTSNRFASIRPPGSPHRRGGHSVIVGDVDEAIDVLERGNPPEAFNELITKLVTRLGVGAPLHAMSSAGLEMLRTGTKPNTRSMSDVEHSVLYYALNAGIDFDTIERALRQHADGAGQHYKKDRALRGDRRALEALQRRWDKATRGFVPPLRTRSAWTSEILARSDAWYAAGWPPRTLKADRDVYGAIVDIALRKNSLEVGASERQLSLAARCAKGTARNAVGRLVSYGALTVIVPGGLRGSAIYKLQPLRADGPNQPLLGGARSPVGSISAQTHRRLDSHGRYALTGLGISVLAALADADRPLRPSELAEATGHSRSGLYKGLPRLVGHGLIVKEDGAWRLTGKLLDDLAVEYGLVEHHARRVALVEAERAALDELFSKFERVTNPETGKTHFLITAGSSTRAAQARKAIHWTVGANPARPRNARPEAGTAP